MKRTTFSLTLLALSLWTTSYSQVEFGLNGGTLFSKFHSFESDHSLNSEPKGSFFAGLYSMCHFSEKWAYRSDLQFQRLHQRISVFQSFNPEFRFDYLSFSPSLIYKPTKWMGIGLGANANYRLNAMSNIIGEWLTLYSHLNDQHHWDFGANAAVYATYKRFTLSAKYNYNFVVEKASQYTDENGEPLWHDLRNQYLQIGVGFKIWQSKSKH